MSNNTLPTLYTFRRCPYAMRARLAIAAAGIEHKSIEVSLKQKPAELLELSPKGTVPVLQTGDGRVLEESLDIMLWALETADPHAWLPRQEAARQNQLEWIRKHDLEFKPLLDKYKYAVRHTELSLEQHRGNAVMWLQQLEYQLEQQQFLISSKCSLADIGIFPFVRQFARVDWDWFEHNTTLPRLKFWLHYMLNLPLFLKIMEKHTNAK